MCVPVTAQRCRRADVARCHSRGRSRLGRQICGAHHPPPQPNQGNLSIHIYIHMFMHVFIHMSIHIYTHMFMHVFIHMSTHTFIHTYLCMCFIHRSIHIYMHIFMHVFIHMSIHTYTHMFMHVFMHMSIQYRRLNLVKVCMSTPVSIHVYRHVSSIYACLLTCLHTCLAPSSSSGLAHFPTLLQPADTTQPGGCLATGHPLMPRHHAHTCVRPLRMSVRPPT